MAVIPAAIVSTVAVTRATAEHDRLGLKESSSNIHQAQSGEDPKPEAPLGTSDTHAVLPFGAFRPGEGDSARRALTTCPGDLGPECDRVGTPNAAQPWSACTEHVWSVVSERQQG